MGTFSGRGFTKIVTLQQAAIKAFMTPSFVLSSDYNNTKAIEERCMDVVKLGPPKDGKPNCKPQRFTDGCLARHQYQSGKKVCLRPDWSGQVGILGLSDGEGGTGNQGNGSNVSDVF